MQTYFIEFRFHRYAKRYLKSTIQEISHKFRVKATSKKVPHLTLFGPFKTNNERQMVNTLMQVCKNYEDKLIPFRLKGFDGFDNFSNKVVFIDVRPSEEMKELRFSIAKSLLKITDTNSVQDKKSKDDFKFHATVAFKDIDKKYSEILSYLKSKPEPSIKQTLLRVTIIKKGKILYEYDLILKRLLNRSESKSTRVLSETIRQLRRRKDAGNFREQKPTDKKKQKSKSLTDKILEFFKLK
jgi:2'-5' RNA ligase